MPIKIGKRTFKTFNEAVNYVMEKKGLGRKRARAYVASIYEKQRKKK
jgi:hypothetical protein